MKTVTLYTDGACSGNPGPGGWGAILEFNGVEKELSGGKNLEDGMFDFALTDDAGEVIETVSNKDGKISFSDLTFDGFFSLILRGIPGIDDCFHSVPSFII